MGGLPSRRVGTSAECSGVCPGFCHKVWQLWRKSRNSRYLCRRVFLRLLCLSILRGCERFAQQLARKRLVSGVLRMSQPPGEILEAEMFRTSSYPAPSIRRISLNLAGCILVSCWGSFLVAGYLRGWMIEPTMVRLAQSTPRPECLCHRQMRLELAGLIRAHEFAYSERGCSR